MLPLVVLVMVTGAARLLGQFAAMRALDSWPEAVGVGIAAMLLLTSSAHFVQPRREALVAMVPPAVGHAPHWVTITGVLEIVGAVGLVVPETRALAGVGVATLLIAMFPANVRAARHGVGITSVALPARALMQALFVAACLFAATA